MMEAKRWQWIDWSLFYFHLFWYVSITAYLMTHVTTFIHNFNWMYFVLFTLSYVVPQFFWRPRYKHIVYFTIVELLLGGLVTGLLYVFADHFTDNMSVPLIIIGYLATKRVAYWSAPIFIIGFPLLGIVLGQQTWDMTVDTQFNHLALYGIGAGYNVFIQTHQKMKALLNENQKQYLIIQQYANQVEALTLKEERDRLAGELHDTVGYAFTSVIMGLKASKALMETEPDKARVKMEGLLVQARMSVDDIRQQIHQITPEESELTFSRHMSEEIKMFTEHTELEVNLMIRGHECKVSTAVRYVLTRCLQEALTNAVRHGHANIVQVTLTYEANKLIFSIKDEGIGMNHSTYGFGLRTMEQRLATVSGELKINSIIDVGTEIVCSVPVKDQLQDKEIRLVIIDDQDLIRESLQIVFMRELDIEVVGSGKNGLEAIERCEELKPHVVLLDVAMPEMNGVEATKRIKQKWPHIKVIILTSFQETDSAMEAISLGAEGYLLKTVHPLDLLSAIRLVYRGGTLMSTEVARQLINLIKPSGGMTSEYKLNPLDKFFLMKDTYGLTDREMQVLECLSLGDKYKEIAQKLYLSEGTVRNYVSSLYSKLEVNNRTQATKKAQLNGLV